MGADVYCAACGRRVNEDAYRHRLRIDTTSQYGTYTTEDKPLCSDCVYQLHLLWASAVEVVAYERRTGRKAMCIE